MKLIVIPKCLNEAISPLVTLSYLMGLHSFEGNRCQLKSLLSLIYLLVLLGAYCVSSHMQQQYMLHSRLLKLQYVLFELVTYIHAIVVSYKMFLSWYYSKRIKICYEEISKIDDTLRQLGLKIDYRKLYFMTIGGIILWTIFIMVLSSFYVRRNLKLHIDLYITIYFTLMRAYGLSVNFIVILDFAMLVKCLEMRFELINRLLYEEVAVSSIKKMELDFFAMQDYIKIKKVEKKKHPFPTEILRRSGLQLHSRMRISVPEKQNSVKWQIQQTHLPFQLQKQFQMELQSRSQNQNFVIREHKKRRHLLQIIKQVHLELCKISKSICSGFGVQTSLEIGLSVIIITGVLYNLYIRLFENEIINDLLQRISSTLLMGIGYSLKIVFMNRVCKNAADEGNKTAEIIHAIDKCDIDIDMREEIHQFGLQILHSPVTFFSFGFSLGYHVLTSCLGTVTTYVVIMIQMSNSLESSNKNIGGAKSN